MTGPAPIEHDHAWHRFVIEHGDRALATDLAFILHRPRQEVARLCATGACAKGGRRKGFAELFRLWNGREPSDEDWPPPRMSGDGKYEWQGRELALLASLVGGLGKTEIAQILTERLRSLTNDPRAARSPDAVQVAINRIGMQSKDVIGGITTAAAARDIGSLAMVHQAIQKGHVRARRVGRLWVIPRDSWAAWKVSRVFPPAGYVPLASLKQPLSIQSDKLSEYARLGYVPTATRCNPFGTGRHSTEFGTWYIDPGVANELIDDRRIGRPMPWHGKPLADNLRTTFWLWQQRRHPPTCMTCASVWGRQGAPGTFEEYTKRYPLLAHGAKRHLTLRWSSGLTVAELARKAGCPAIRVRRAIANGALNASERRDGIHVGKTDACRWISRACPAGDTQRSWISAATASKRYLFTRRELNTFIAEGKVQSKVGTEGAARGVVYLPRQQCASLREKIGFTEQEAARRAGVTVSKLRAVLAGVNWRGESKIPLVTVQAVIKRLQSRPGFTIDDAAAALGKDRAWVEDRINDGTVRPLRRQWDADRLYISEPMMRRLRQAATNPESPGVSGDHWLRLGEAALEAGVTATTVMKWASRGELERVHSPTGWRYPRNNVRARARQYWKQTRFRRPALPTWLAAEAPA